jgi:actin related protein 2/3 complex subunit 2
MIVYEALQGRLLEGRREPCEITCSDFDDVSFKLVATAENPAEMTLSMYIRNIDNLKRDGASEVLDQMYPGMEVRAESGYSLSLRFNLDNITDPPGMLVKLSELKKNILGAPLRRAINSMLARQAAGAGVVTVNYRAQESFYVIPANDKVTVIFLIAFADETDRAAARVFLQEFVEAQRSVSNAPPCGYSREPPLELRDVRVNVPDTSAGFLTFVLENRHVSSPDRVDKVVSMLASFRGYLHYHIKATKTYLHMRMRKRVVTWLQVLNRAVPEQDTEKKTAGGKSFKRK